MTGTAATLDRPVRHAGSLAGPGTPHPTAVEAARKFGPGGVRVDTDGLVPMSLQSPASLAQSELFKAGSPVKKHFDGLLARAQKNGETIQTASIGCGSHGYDLAHMAARLSGQPAASKVLGFDVDAQSIARVGSEVKRVLGSGELSAAASQHFGTIEQHAMDFADWHAKNPECAGSLHAITSSATTPYMDDSQLSANLAAMHAALQPGGLAVITAFGKQHDGGGLAMHLRSQDELEASARQAGFETLKPGCTKTLPPFETVTVYLVKPS